MWTVDQAVEIKLVFEIPLAQCVCVCVGRGLKWFASRTNVSFFSSLEITPFLLDLNPIPTAWFLFKFPLREIESTTKLKQKGTLNRWWLGQ